ncbi:nucleotidyltransferase family protein [Arsenicicoccus cauae]|uniref:nucleotidyltransferase family protein n=1 Tax=Arsenicicoccus cauae TaxID=2663847 RepID=UPI00370CFDCB
MKDSESLNGRLLRAVLADSVCRTILDRMPELALPEWWLTAGAIFQNVWNDVEGHPAGYGVKDYDVFYFDTDLSWEAEDAVIRRAAELFGGLGAKIELRNEARVHLWYEEKFGTPASPFRSATDAIDAFAATTCSVGVTRDRDRWRIHAPFSLHDTFGMHMRPNRRLAPRHVYETKVAQYRERWPSLAADPW